MTLSDAFLALQEPHTATPICALAVIMVAIWRRNTRTALTLGAITILLLVLWATAPEIEAPLIGAFSYSEALYVLMLLAFFGIAIHERAWVPIYVALMPLINWSFGAVQTYEIPTWLGGGMFQPLAIVTGLVLVVRDLAQREVKHWVWAAMIVGLLLSTLTSWIVIVFASGAAFLISETVDWAVYTFSKRPLSQRIMISSAVSAPLDQLIFIGLASQIPSQAGIFALGTILTGVASKLFGAFIVSRTVARQERRTLKSEMNPA